MEQYLNKLLKLYIIFITCFFILLILVINYQYIGAHYKFKVKIYFIKGTCFITKVNHFKLSIEATSSNFSNFSKFYIGY
jgi:hypothetical protein